MIIRGTTQPMERETWMSGPQSLKDKLKRLSDRNKKNSSTMLNEPKNTGMKCF